MNPNKITDVDTNIECITFEVMKTSLFVLFKDGSAGACSRNNSGQLGGTNKDRTTIIVVEPLPNDP